MDICMHTMFVFVCIQIWIFLCIQISTLMIFRCQGTLTAHQHTAEISIKISKDQLLKLYCQKHGCVMYVCMYVCLYALASKKDVIFRKRQEHMSKFFKDVCMYVCMYLVLLILTGENHMELEFINNKIPLNIFCDSHNY